METHESFDSKPELETPDRVVIIGGGLAGAKTAQALRDKGFAGGITIVAAEQHLPYERPLLSKEYLTGRKPYEKALVLPEGWYDEHAVSLVRGVEATVVDRIGSRVPKLRGYLPCVPRKMPIRSGALLGLTNDWWLLVAAGLGLKWQPRREHAAPQ